MSPSGKVASPPASSSSSGERETSLLSSELSFAFFSSNTRKFCCSRGASSLVSPQLVNEKRSPSQVPIEALLGDGVSVAPTTSKMFSKQIISPSLIVPSVSPNLFFRENKMRSGDLGRMRRVFSHDFCVSVSSKNPSMRVDAQFSPQRDKCIGSSVFNSEKLPDKKRAQESWVAGPIKLTHGNIIILLFGGHIHDHVLACFGARDEGGLVVDEPRKAALAIIEGELTVLQGPFEGTL